jgi:hypothetical protein
VQFEALRDGPKISFDIMGVNRTHNSQTEDQTSLSGTSGSTQAGQPSMPASAQTAVLPGSPSGDDGEAASIGSTAVETDTADPASEQHHQDMQQQQQGNQGAASVAMHAAPRPPWLRPGAGIEDPAVWSVKKCQQLLGQMLMRAPGAKFPPIAKDLLLMQVT